MNAYQVHVVLIETALIQEAAMNVYVVQDISKTVVIASVNCNLLRMKKIFELVI